ncbi:hypothetical protein CI109_106265 [Kwoniella shandongensis]|uniref:Uncharacterized protein n=1 Tax=Kwoniella shandongensis TaxID=1734106 RepID=A0A5M6BYI2_9TREE|nr:uncharacterized protein CI109_003868 [Kwoniella shandongensis]KAA5527896.1 hypothetical protein CI109_003868 [Kwoniella shandongensis]
MSSRTPEPNQHTPSPLHLRDSSPTPSPLSSTSTPLPSSSLFYKAPHSTPSSPLTQPSTRLHSIALSSYSSTAHVPLSPVPHVGVVNGVIDERTLGEMINPLERVDLVDKEDRTGGGKAKERESWWNVSTSQSTSQLPSTRTVIPEEATPPPLPPKPLPTTTPRSTRTVRSVASTTSAGATYDSHGDQSTVSGTTEIPIPTTALHGRRASASSHHLLTHPSLASLISRGGNVIPSVGVEPNPDDNTGVQRSVTKTSVGTSSSSEHSSGDRTNRKIAAALAKLPWAEPPPRQPSPYLPSPQLAPSGSNTSSLSHRVAGGPGTERSDADPRTPTYSFLDSDPAARPPASTIRSRRSSSVSSSSLPTTPAQYLQGAATSPAGPSGTGLLSASSEGNGFDTGDQRRFSALSRFSGMADIVVPSTFNSSQGHTREQEHEHGMNDVDHAGPAPASSSGQSGIGSSPSSAMATKASSRTASISRRQKAFERFKRSNSNSTTRSRSSRSKRGSSSTLGHKVGGKKWEIRHYEELVGSGERTNKDGGEVDVKRKEEMMELVSLVGRAVVLERMLRAGKRISNQSMKKGYKESRFSISSSRHPPTPKISGHHFSSSPTTEHRPSLSLSLSVSTSVESKARPASRGSKSLRDRLSRRLIRSKSREDLFTELDSDDDDPGLFPDQDQRGMSETAGEGRKDGKDEEGRGGDQGVVVFPEVRTEVPPSVPVKDRRTRLGLGETKTYLSGSNIDCTTVVCLSPTSPTPFLSQHLDPEKGFSDSQHWRTSTQHQEGQSKPDEGETKKWYPQSPHLGHRSPNWRNRQSVVSYLSTGVWDERARRKWWIVIGIGAGIVVVVIVGLLAGLLSRHEGS